jgi:hypothetical protein
VPIGIAGRGVVNVEHARAVAWQWVMEEASTLPGFFGAYLSGSMSAMPDDAVLPIASDVDVKVVIDDVDVPGNPQKFVYRDVVLDVSYGSREDVGSPEAVLGNYYTAVHFTRPCIISDPSGQMTKIQPIVAREYARRRWVRERCEHAREQMLSSLTWLNAAAPIHDQVFAWLLAMDFATHMVVVADLRNPTHRKCLVSFKEVLARYHHLSLHERMLGILGSASLRRGQVEALLKSCADAFDVAQAIRATPFLLASNISDFARPIAIEGSQEIITGGFHREAVLWIGAIHTWCQKSLYNDASDEVRSRFTPTYERLLLALGVPTPDELEDRMERIRQLVPDLWNVTEEIIERNPSIVD